MASKENTQFLLRLPKELHKWFKDQAKAERRSMTQEMNLALETWKKQIELYKK